MSVALDEGIGLGRCRSFGARINRLEIRRRMWAIEISLAVVKVPAIEEDAYPDAMCNGVVSDYRVQKRGVSRGKGLCSGRRQPAAEK